MDPTPTTDAPAPRRRRWLSVVLATVGVVAVLAFAAVWLLYDGLYWSPVNYATSCRRPLADYCTECPTLAKRERSQGETRSCGLGTWHVVVMQGYDQYSEDYFDRTGRLVAVFHAGMAPPDRCGRDWYGAFVLCRVAPLRAPGPSHRPSRPPSPVPVESQTVFVPVAMH
jgi:hypothetical protein